MEDTKRPADSDDRENRATKAAKLTDGESSRILGSKLSNALCKQFTCKIPPEKETFEEFLAMVDTGKKTTDFLCFLSYKLCKLCKSCGLFEEDFKHSEVTVFEKCKKVVDEVVGRRSNATYEQSEECLEAAWNAEYHDSNEKKVVDVFLKYIRACNTEYSEGAKAWHSPCIAVCQSSGWGKSRLLSELGKKIPVLYLSFLHEDSTGYPSRTQQTIKKLMTLRQKDTRLNTTMWLQTVSYVDHMLSGEGHKEMKMVNLDKEECNWYDVMDVSTDDIELKNDLIVIAFDEANELLEDNRKLFRATERLLSDLSTMTNGKVFGVMTDTNSRTYNNFARLSALDSSAKGVMDLRDHLPPFVLGGLNDCFESEVGLKWTEPQSMLGFGRPLWGAMYTSQLKGSKDWIYKEVAAYAAAKLCGGIVPKVWSSEHFLQSLSCIFARLATSLNPCHSATCNLTAKHMATLLAVSPNSETILATYTSEPVLAMGAASLWAQESVLIGHMLPNLRHAVMQGIVQERDLKEMVACIIMLLIMDRMSTASNYYHGEFFTFEKFLRRLGAKKSDVMDLRNKVPSSAMIGFGHFVSWHRDIEKADLAMLSRCRAAAILKRKQRGSELLLPLWWNVGEACDENFAYGFVSVQVKNRFQASDLAEVGDELSNDFVFKPGSNMRELPSVQVLIDIGLAANEEGKSACMMVKGIEKDGIVVFECLEKYTDENDQEQAKEITAKKSDQVPTDDDFCMLSMRGFEHLHLMEELQNEDERTDESKEEKTKKCEAGGGKESETGESKDSEEHKEEGTGTNHKVEKDVKKLLRSLLVGPIDPEDWYKAECCSKSDKDVYDSPHFFSNMLRDK